MADFDDAVIKSLRDAINTAGRTFGPEKQNLTTPPGPAGAVGRIIGDPRHHAGNIATITIVGLLLILGATILSMFSKDWSSVTRPYFEDMKSIVLSLIALMGTILGYIFGRSSSSN